MRYDESGDRIATYAPQSGRLAVWRVDSSSVSGTASYLWQRLTGHGQGSQKGPVRGGASPTFTKDDITPQRPNLGPNALAACSVRWQSPRQVAVTNGMDEGSADAGPP